MLLLEKENSNDNKSDMRRTPNALLISEAFWFRFIMLSIYTEIAELEREVVKFSDKNITYNPEKD